MPAYRDTRGRWRYRFRRRGRRYGGSAPPDANTKTAAIAAERAHLARVDQRERVHAGGMPTVRRFVRLFLRHQKPRIKPLTYEALESVLRVHVVPEIGDLPLDEVGTRVLAELGSAWSATGVSPRTVNYRLWTVARLLSLAVELELLVGAPRPRYLRVPRRLPRFLTDEEAHRLLEAAPERWRSMILVAMRTGLRIGELRGLQWSDVDFVRGVIVVRRTDPGRADMPATSPKGGAERIVALSPEAFAVLAVMRSAAGEVLPGAPVWPSFGRWPSLAQAMRTRSMRSCWSAMSRAAKAAGLERVSWHTLRHTCASQLAMRGVSLRIIQAVLGHASIRQTEIYAHLAPGAVFHAAMASLDLPLAPTEMRIRALPEARG